MLPLVTMQSIVLKSGLSNIITITNNDASSQYTHLQQPVYHSYHNNESRVSILSLQSTLKLPSWKSSKPQTSKSTIIDWIMSTPREIKSLYEATINLGHSKICFRPAGQQWKSRRKLQGFLSITKSITKTVIWVWHQILRQDASWDNMLCGNFVQQNLIMLCLYLVNIYLMIMGIVWKDLAIYIIAIDEYLSREIMISFPLEIYSIFSTDASICYRTCPYISLAILKQWKADQERH